MSRLIETHSARNPRLLFFHAAVVAMVVLLVGKLTYLQFRQTAIYSDKARVQNQRRVIVPGPRGNIYDRDGQVLVGNRARLSVVLNLAELRPEFRAEYDKVRLNYVALAPGDRPSSEQMSRIARATVAQRYLDQVNLILGRSAQVRTDELHNHIRKSLLLPFVLLDDLAPEEYARLIERLPVISPLQVYTSSTRHYPHGSTAAHTLGYTGVNSDPEVEGFEGEDLPTFKMKGTVGRAGLEVIFDEQLQGETGATIHLVDPVGYIIKSSDLPHRKPVQGHDVRTSLDLDLQLAAETAMEGRIGAAVALDVQTGEVLVLASKPDFDPVTRVPNLPPDLPKEDFDKSGVWLNRAIQGQYPPGSTFKIITAIAGLRSQAIESGLGKVYCPGFYRVGNRDYPCHQHAGHGEVDLVKALTLSCNVFFYKYGLDNGPELIAAEARRFGFSHPTGIELPSEFRSPRVADPAWKKLHGQDKTWYPGDTANISIGQGDTLITPLQAACMVASFARGEIETKPTLLHVANRAPQHTERIGLSPADYATLMKGLGLCYELGTGRLAKVEGLSGGAKSGTAQLGRKDLAWLVAFAPLENPRIAVAVVLEGAVDDNTFGGGTYAAPVVRAILAAWKDKRDRPSTKPVNFKVE